MQLGPEEVLLNLAVDFHEGLSGGEVMHAIRRVEDAIRCKHPEVRRIFIETKFRDPDRPSNGEACSQEAHSSEDRSALTRN